MNKSLLNRITRKFGFEIHGNGFIQSLKKTSFKEDAFSKQKELLAGVVSTIFDVGANVGQITLQYAALFPGADIYAFEPFPATFAVLKANTVNIKKIQVEEMALSDARELRTFYVNHNADTNSLLEPTRMGLSSDAQVVNKSVMSVQADTIDAYCLRHTINSIDILKLDIQGGELAALQGASAMLAEKKIKLIYTETYFRKQYMNQPLFHEIADFLSTHKYYVQDFYNPIYGKGSIAWCDAIFLPA